jgi:hypothetical protein
MPPYDYLPPWPSIFINFYCLVHHPVDRDAQHLLECAMASDFSVAWQFSQREQLVFHYGSSSVPLM